MLTFGQAVEQGGLQSSLPAELFCSIHHDRAEDFGEHEETFPLWQPLTFNKLSA